MVSVAEGGEKRPDNEFIAVSKKKKKKKCGGRPSLQITII